MFVKIGADPEMFVRDKKTLEYVSAHGLIEGDKKNPYRVPHGAIQVDGMAVEFNVDPASSKAGFLRNIKRVMGHLGKAVGNQYDLHAVSSLFFDKKVWDATPQEAKILGCDPDFNAWNEGEVNQVADLKNTMRTAAGHIHIGWGNDIPIDHPTHIEACQMAIKQLDCYLGLKSLSYDTDSRRRTLYGAAGAYRPKSYGVEYRVLSNKWLESDKLIGEVYDHTRFCITELAKGHKFYDYHQVCPYGNLYPPDLLKQSSVDKKTKRDIDGLLQEIKVTSRRFYGGNAYV